MLADARRGRGWSLREAARRIGCAPGTVVHLERGRRAPSVVLAHGIVGAYRLDDHQADMLMAEAVDNAGKSSPYKR
jgi:transcriptional regulator with XRE-family HTH domain